MKTVVTLKVKAADYFIIILASAASRTLYCTAIRPLVLRPGTLYRRGARTRRCLTAQALLGPRTRPLSWPSRPEAEVITSVPGRRQRHNRGARVVADPPAGPSSRARSSRRAAPAAPSAAAPPLPTARRPLGQRPFHALGHQDGPPALSQALPHPENG